MNTEQLQNLKDLRALGRRILADRERYPLNLDRIECGSHACWLGWHRREFGPVAGYMGDHDQQLFFGLPKATLYELFNTAPSMYHHGVLESRLATLDKIIAANEHKPTGIPIAVRKIFDVQEQVA